MSEKLIIFILLVVYLARPKQPDEYKSVVKWNQVASIISNRDIETQLFILLLPSQKLRILWFTISHP